MMFSYKKPKGVPHKFDAEKQATFMADYEVLNTSLNDDEPLLFGCRASNAGH